MNHALMYVVNIRQERTSRCILIVLSCLFGTLACSDSRPPTDHHTGTAQRLVDSAILAMGGQHLESAEVRFTLRDRDYIYRKQDGIFEYVRIWIDPDSNRVVDYLNNDSLRRVINGVEAELTDERQQAFTNSVNGVIYYAFLPYRLNDEAVIKTYNGETSIKGRRYHEILVQFEKEGGGVDYQDNYLFWIDPGDYSVDYLAYDYVTDGGGVRFREAFNRRRIGEIIMQDYLNYRPSDDTMQLRDMADAFNRDELVHLSTIALEDVTIRIY